MEHHDENKEAKYASDLDTYKAEKVESHLAQDSGGHEGDEVAWLTSYADMMTVLCCFFILLVSMAEFDAKKFGNAVETIATHFVPEKQMTKTGKVEEEKGQSKIAKAQEGTGTQEGGSNTDTEKLKAMEQMISLLSAQLKDNDIAKVKKDNGLQVVFTGISMFEGGEAKPTKDVDDAIDLMVQIIKSKGSDFNILIEGHTDDKPIVEGLKFPSNWELSSARAAYVLRKFEKAGFDPKKLVAVGYADTRPAFPNINGLGRPIPENQRLNRRVVIKVIPPSLTKEDRERMGLGIFFNSTDSK